MDKKSLRNAISAPSSSRRRLNRPAGIVTQVTGGGHFTAGRVIVRGKMVNGVRPSGPTTSSTTSPTSPSPSSRPRTTTTPSATACSRRWTTPRCWTCPSSSAPTATRFLFHDRHGHSGQVETRTAARRISRPRTSSGSATAPCKGIDDAQTKPSSPRTTTPTPAARRPATTSSTPSTAPSRPSPRARTASCWSWPPAPARPTPPSRSSGGCGRPAARNASCSWPTATSWSTRPGSTTSSRSARR